MFHTTSRWIYAAGLVLAVAAPVRAQYGVAHLTHADGGVTRLHRGAPAATTIGVSIMDGDQVETTNGRAEITFLDGTLVHLDRHSAIVIAAPDRARMVAGRVSLRTSGSRTFVVEAAGAKLHAQATTVLDMSSQAGRPDATIRVVSGKARVESTSGSSQVPDYHRVYLAGTATAPHVSKVVPEPADEFERWALTRLVMASSTPLKGTEHGGGVAYSPYGYFGYGLYGYSAPYAYTYSYTRYYYPVTRYYSYVTPIYSYGSAYYGSPYYYSSGTPYYGASAYSSNYYATTPIRSFYGANINTASSYVAPSSQFFNSGTATSTPALPAPSWAATPTPTGAPKAPAVPKP